MYQQFQAFRINGRNEFVRTIYFDLYYKYRYKVHKLGQVTGIQSLWIWID